jgi:hypothetical protein
MELGKLIEVKTLASRHPSPSFIPAKCWDALSTAPYKFTVDMVSLKSFH